MSPSKRPAPRGPLTVYVLWHPDNEEGPDLARSLFDWLRTIDGAHSQRGSEIPVYYRSRPWRDTVGIPGLGGAAPLSSSAPEMEDQPVDLAFPFRPYRIDDTGVTTLIVLIDANMACDESWRRHLYELGRHRKSHKESLLIIPVEIGPGYSSLHPIFSSINAIRVDHWRDKDDDPGSTRSRRRARLRRYVTQTIARHLLTHDAASAEMLPRSVFVSHAKQDREHGVGVAEAIQRAALASGQVEVFMDSTHLPWGDEWKAPMENAAGWRTAAFIAVVSDSYAARHWCRREIGLARKPRRIANDIPIWRVQPMVSVQSLNQRWTRLLGELGGISTLRWRDESSAEEVLDRLWVEALQAAVHARYASNVLQAVQYSARDDLHFITWNPDPHTLVELSAALPESQKPLRVIYPGHGMMDAEEDNLSRWFKNQVKFESLDELVDIEVQESPKPPKAQAWTPRTWLALDTPEAEELHALGLGTEHVWEGAFRIARGLLDGGVGVSFGGEVVLNRPLLDLLLDSAAAASKSHDRSSPLDPQQLATAQSILACHLGWKDSAKLPREREAALIGRCHIYRWGDDGGSTTTLLLEAESQLTLARRITQGATACREMLMVGGANEGWVGWCPPLLLQAAAMIETERPVLPLAIFGGWARRLVAWALTESPRPFDLLDAQALRTLKGNEELRTLLSSSSEAERRFHDELRRVKLQLERWRAKLPREPDDPSYGGLDADALRTLMTTDSIRVVRRMLRWRQPGAGAS